MTTIHLLTGPNEVLKRKRIGKLTEPFQKDNILSIYAEEHEPPEIFSQCYQSSLFGEGNAVVIRQAGDLKDSQKKKFAQSFLRYAENHNSDMTVIVDWDDPPAEVSRKIKGLAHVSVEEFKTSYRSGIEDYIRASFREAGVKAGGDVVDFIADMSGENLEDADMFCRNLIDYAGEKAELSFEDAKAMLSRSHTASVFDLVDGIFTRDTALALKALQDLRLNSEPALMINAILLKSARNAWGFLTIKAGDEQKKRELGLKDYPYRKLKDYARHINLKYVSGVLELVGEIDVRSKTMPEEFAFIELENFILTMRD